MIFSVIFQESTREHAVSFKNLHLCCKVLCSLIEHIRLASLNQLQSELIRDWLLMPTRFPSLVRALEAIPINLYESELQLQELLLKCLQSFPEQCSSFKVSLKFYNIFNNHKKYLLINTHLKRCTNLIENLCIQNIVSNLLSRSSQDVEPLTKQCCQVRN